MLSRFAELADEEVAARIQQGEFELAQELFERYRDRLRGCAHRMVSPAEVEDATQDMALRVLQGLKTFRGESALGTWIFSVARHTCLDVLRRRRPAGLPLLEDSPEMSASPPPLHSFEMGVMACRTSVAVRQLPQTQQEVVLLRLGAGLSTEETARELGVTADAVKARLRRARAKLRESLGETIRCPQCGPGAYRLENAVVK